MSSYLVRSIMRPEFPTVAPGTPMRRAVALLVETRSAAAPVIDEAGQLLGILTQKDCFRPTLHASYHREWTGRVSDYMSRHVVSVDVEDEVIRVAEMFIAHPHRVFPAVDGARVAGLVHRSDVLALLTRIG